MYVVKRDKIWRISPEGWFIACPVTLTQYVCNRDGKGLLRGTTESSKNGTAPFKSVLRWSWLLLQPIWFKLINPLLSIQSNCFLIIHVSCIKEIRGLRLLFKAASLRDWNIFISIPVLSGGRADEVCKFSDNIMLPVSFVNSSTVSQSLRRYSTWIVDGYHRACGETALCCLRHSEAQSVNTTLKRRLSALWATLIRLQERRSLHSNKMLTGL